MTSTNGSTRWMLGILVTIVLAALASLSGFTIAHVMSNGHPVSEQKVENLEIGQRSLGAELSRMAERQRIILEVIISDLPRDERQRILREFNNVR